MPTMNKLPRPDGAILAYARRSRSVDGDNWEAQQREEMIAYAEKAFGERPALFIVEETKLPVFERPGLSKTLEIAAEGHLGILLLPSSAALAALPGALRECLSRFERLGVRVHSMYDRRDIGVGDTKAGESKWLPGSADNLPNHSKAAVRRVVGYAKCQGGGSTISVQNQLFDAFAFCTLGQGLDDFYCDANGRLTWERPAFRALMQDVEAGRIGTIIVADFDRLGRTQLLETEFKQRCEHFGVIIHSVSDVPPPRITAKPRPPLPSWLSKSDQSLHLNRIAWTQFASIKKAKTRRRAG